MSEEYEPRGLQLLADAIDRSQLSNPDYDPQKTRNTLHSHLDRIQLNMYPGEISCVLIHGATMVIKETAADIQALRIDFEKLGEEIHAQQIKQISLMQPLLSPSDESSSLSTRAS